MGNHKKSRIHKRMKGRGFKRNKGYDRTATKLRVTDTFRCYLFY